MKRSGRNPARANKAQAAVRATRDDQALAGLTQQYDEAANTARDRRFNGCDCEDARRPSQGLAKLTLGRVHFEETRLRQAA